VTDVSLSPVEHARARARADQIRLGIAAIAELPTLIVDAAKARDDLALGYASWDAYCDGEFRSSMLRLPRDERAEVVGQLREAGLSYRMIGSALGVSHPTVISDARATGNSLPVDDVDEDADDLDAVPPDPAKQMYCKYCRKDVTPWTRHETIDGFGDTQSGCYEQAVCSACDAGLTPAELVTCERHRPLPRTRGLDGRSRPSSMPPKPRPDVPIQDLEEALERRHPGAAANRERLRVIAEWSRVAEALQRFTTLDELEFGATSVEPRMVRTVLNTARQVVAWAEQTSKAQTRTGLVVIDGRAN
jgi:hypothetical protein